MSMGIYIKGMDKPENCHKCEFVDILSTCPCNKMEYEDFWYNGSLAVGVHKDCPIISVPPHGRLIDAEKIYDAVEQRYRISSGIEHRCERDLLDLICAAPTIIEAEEGET